MSNIKPLSKQFAVLTLIIAALSTIFSVVFYYAVLPTERHRVTDRELSSLTLDPTTALNGQSAAHKRYEALIQTPEAEYTMLMGGILTVVWILLALAVVWYSYSYARKQRAVKRTKTFVFSALMVGGGLGVLAELALGKLGMNYYLLEQMPSFVSFIAMLTLSAIVTWITIAVVEVIYNKRNSLIVE